jgi:hypothetical protein
MLPEANHQTYPKPAKKNGGSFVRTNLTIEAAADQHSKTLAS